MDLFSLAARLTLDKSDFDRGVSDADKTGKNLANRLGKSMTKAAKDVAKGIGAVYTAAAVTTSKIVKDAFKEYGELEQNLGGSEAVFKAHADRIQRIGAEAYKNMGLSQNQFLASANKMGSLLKGSGFSEGEAAEMAVNWMQRAADVASIMGISIEDAMTAVNGAAKGNFTMMDNLGVAMNATTLEAYALSKGIAKSYNDMTQAEKVGLAYDYFLEQTADYAGNYARENDTLAGSISSLKGAWANFLSGAGDADAVAEMLDNVLDSISRTADTLIPRLAQGFSMLVSKLAPRLPAIVKKIMPAITQGFTAIMRSLPGVLREVVTGAANGVISIINGIFGTHIPEITELRWPTWDEVGTAAATAWATIQNEAKRILSLVFGNDPIRWPTWGEVGAAAERAWNVIKNEAKSVLSLVFGNDPIEWPTWSQVEAAANNAWTAISGELKRVFKFVFGESPDGGIAWPTWDDVKSAAETAWDAIKTGLTSVFRFIFGETDDGGIAWPTWDNVRAAAENAWDAIKTGLSNVFRFVFGETPDGGIQWPTWEDVREAASDAWNAIKSALTGVFRFVFGETEDGGIQWPTWSDVRSAAESAWENIKNGAKSILSLVFGNDPITWPTWEDVGDALTTAWQAIQTGAATVLHFILGGDSFEFPTWEQIEEAAGDVIGTIVNGLRNLFKATIGLNVPSWAELRVRYGGAFDDIISGLSTIFTPEEGTTFLGNAFSGVGRIASGVYGVITALAGNVGSILTQIGTALQNTDISILQTAGSIITGIGNVLQWIDENSTMIGNALISIFTAVAAAEVFTKLSALINDFKLLANGSTAIQITTQMGGFSTGIGSAIGNLVTTVSGIKTLLETSALGPAALIAAVTTAIKLADQHNVDASDNETRDRMIETEEAYASLDEAGQQATAKITKFANSIGTAQLSVERPGVFNRLLVGTRWLDDMDVMQLMQNFGHYAFPLRYGYDQNGEYVPVGVENQAQFDNIFRPGANDEFRSKYMEWLIEGMPINTTAYELATGVTNRINQSLKNYNTSSYARQTAAQLTEATERMEQGQAPEHRNYTSNPAIGMNGWRVVKPRSTYASDLGMSDFYGWDIEADAANRYSGWNAASRESDAAAVANRIAEENAGTLREFTDNLVSAVREAMSALSGATVNLDGAAIGNILVPRIYTMVGGQAVRYRYKK